MRYLVSKMEGRDECRQIHTEEPLFHGWFGPDYKFSEYKKLADADRDFVDRLVAVKGVVRLYMDPYRCTVEKGGVFSWDEVLAPLLALFEERYGTLQDVSLPEDRAFAGEDLD